METINQRIDFLIKELGFTKTKFAESLHVSSQFVSSLCSGAKQPSDRTIADICREYGVSETWLRTGEGEMKQKLTPAQMQRLSDIAYGMALAKESKKDERKEA